MCKKMERRGEGVGELWARRNPSTAKQVNTSKPPSGVYAEPNHNTAGVKIDKRQRQGDPIINCIPFSVSG